MKVLLICPPIADFTIPYLSLPALAAYLRSLEISVSQWDLNLDFALHVFRKDYCAASRDRVLARHRELDGRPSLPNVRVRPRTPMVDPETVIGVKGATTLSSAANCELSQRSRVMRNGSSSP